MMWLSRKRYRAILDEIRYAYTNIEKIQKRLEKFEETINPKLHIYLYNSITNSGSSIQVNEVVEEILQHLGLRIEVHHQKPEQIALVNKK